MNFVQACSLHGQPFLETHAFTAWCEWSSVQGGTQLDGASAHALRPRKQEAGRSCPMGQMWAQRESSGPTSFSLPVRVTPFSP